MAGNIELPNEYMGHDMVESMALKDDLESIRWTQELGAKMIESVELSIGGRSVQKDKYVNGELVTIYPPYTDDNEERQTEFHKVWQELSERKNRIQIKREANNNNNNNFGASHLFGTQASMHIRRNPETGSAVTESLEFKSGDQVLSQWSNPDTKIIHFMIPDERSTNPETGSAITGRPFFNAPFKPFPFIPFNRTTACTDYSKRYYPLSFHSSNIPTGTLPLVALQYHDVQVTVHDKEDESKKRQLTDDELVTSDQPMAKHQKTG